VHVHPFIKDPATSDIVILIVQGWLSLALIVQYCVNSVLRKSVHVASAIQGRQVFSMTDSMDQDLDWRVSRESALTLAIEQDDIVSLRKWSVEPGGFGTNELRQKVW
jgi:hypothetical protein